VGCGFRHKENFLTFAGHPFCYKTYEIWISLDLFRGLVFKGPGRGKDPFVGSGFFVSSMAGSCGWGTHVPRVGQEKFSVTHYGS